MANPEQASRCLCSELVSVLYEDSSRRTHRTVANLEEISSDTAALLSELPVAVETPISFTVKDNDLYGIAESVEYDPLLGWFTTVRFDRSSRWSGRRFVPEHFLALCSMRPTTRPCVPETAPLKVFTLKKHYVTEKKMRASFSA
jgi:hypothetical protein